MKQIFTFFGAAFLCLVTTIGHAQFSNNFDTNGSYASNCWTFEGFFQTTTASEVINGTASLYTNPPTNNNGSGTSDVYTPYLNIASTTFSVSFKYKLSATLSGQAVRNIEVGLMSRSGVFTSLDVVTMRGNSSTLTQTNLYSKTFTLASTSVQRLVLKFSGSQGDGNTRMIVDDLLVNANAYYNGTTNCNSAPVAVNNTYNATSATAPYIGTSVLYNDSDPNGEAPTATLATPSIDGTVVMNTDGTFTFTPNPGFTGSFTTFTYKVTDDGYDRMSTTATVYIYFSQVATLPVQLLHFSGTVAAKANLTWSVSSNETGLLFEVQRSINGNFYQNIATVFTSEKIGNEQYQFIDAIPTQTTSYRLKVVNKDGTAFYSPMILFKAAAEAAKITLIQNPVQNTLRFTVPATQYISAITIYNINGVIMYSDKTGAAKNQTTISLPLPSNLPPGIYILQVRTDSGSKSATFIKQ